jgi:hypothetical protein
MNIDADLKNSDWIKSFRLDIHGEKSLNAIMEMFGIPMTDPEMTEGLAKLNQYPWVDSLPGYVKATIRRAAKIEKRAERQADRLVK